MNRRRVSPLLIAAVLAGSALGLSACSLLPFRHKTPPAAEAKRSAGKKPMGHGLVLEMQASPDPLKLAEARELTVTLILRNVTPAGVTLKFPTTQIFEILLRNPNNGQIISQWSSEHTFTSEPRLLIVNHGERLEYPESITTRELKAGTPYTLEAYLVGYEKELRATKAILPQP